jgi:hypothetical protein
MTDILVVVEGKIKFFKRRSNDLKRPTQVQTELKEIPYLA